MKIDDRYVIEQFWIGKQSVLKRYINKKKVDNVIIEYLKNRFDDTDNIYESLYRIKHNIKDAPKCPICGNPISFTNGYKEYCSRACANRNPKRILHAKETYAKKRKSNEHTTVSIVEKRKPDKSDFKNHNNIKKPKNVKLDSYIIEHYSNIDNFKKVISKLTDLNNEQIYRYEMLLENYNLHASKQKDICFYLLSIIYNDIVRQYEHDKYKIKCDFYVPSQDLYIKLQCTWAHGGHPYTGNYDDLEKLKLWKSKIDEGHLYYKNAICTWVDLDIRKRNIAKLNNLNYIEFWKLEEVFNYIKKIIKLLKLYIND